MRPRRPSRLRRKARSRTPWAIMLNRRRIQTRKRTDVAIQRHEYAVTRTTDHAHPDGRATGRNEVKQSWSHDETE